MRRHAATCLLTLLLVPVLAGMSSGQTADEVIEKHVAALGGREALGKLTTRTSTGTARVSTPTADLSGTAEILTKAPTKTRIVLRLDLAGAGGTGELIVGQIFDGTNAYSLNSLRGDTPITGRQLEGLRNNVFPSPLLSYKSAGVTLELLPREQVNGHDAIVLSVGGKASSTTRIYFDAETYLVVRTIATLDSPTAGPLEQTSDMSDYRTVDGVKVPFLIVNSNPTQTVTIRLTRVEHNLEIPDATFVKK